MSVSQVVVPNEVRESNVDILENLLKSRRQLDLFQVETFIDSNDRR